MPYPVKWTSGMLISGSDWNDLRLYRAADYIIFPESGNYYAYGQFSGSTDYSGVDASAVIQNAINALTSGGNIFFKNGVYELATELKWTTDSISLYGEGYQTEIRADASMDNLINITGSRYAHFKDLFINGYGLADVCINGYRTTSGVPVHIIEHCKVWGALDANIDYTGCEDSTLLDVWLDGRKDIVEPPTLYTDYGLRIGTSGNKTGGHVKIYDVKMGFHEIADAYLKNIVDIAFYGCLFSSKHTYSKTKFTSHIIAEGGTGDGAVWPKILISGCWFDGGTNTGSNIRMQNVTCKEITIIGSSLYATSGSNISDDGTLNPGAEIITIIGSQVENLSGYYNVNCSGSSLVALNIDFYGGSGVNTSKINKYMIYKYEQGLEINLDTSLHGADLNMGGGQILFADVLSLTGSTTGDMIQFVKSGKPERHVVNNENFGVYDITNSVWNFDIHSGSKASNKNWQFDFHGGVLKDMSGSAVSVTTGSYAFAVDVAGVTYWIPCGTVTGS